VRRMLEELMLELLKAYSPTGSESEAVRKYVGIVSKWWEGDVVVDRVGNAILTYGNGSKWILLAGHIDTVPGELPVGYDGHVFRGRGAVDAKGPLTSMTVGAIEAIKHLREGDCRVTVAALVAEEGRSYGARELVSSGIRPTAIVVGEPSGCSGVIVGYRGSIKLGVKCHGVSGHSSTPQSGVSAVDELINSWLRMRDVINSIPNSNITINYIRGGQPFSVIPKDAEAVIDIRVPVDGDLNVVKALVVSALTNRCTYEVIDETPPVKVSVNNTVVRSLIRSLIKNGLRPSPVIKLGTSDMNLLARITDNIVGYGPGRSELSHTDREEISITELEIGAKVYRDTILEFCSHP